jgi:hypothetical protein
MTSTDRSLTRLISPLRFSLVALATTVLLIAGCSGGDDAGSASSKGDAGTTGDAIRDAADTLKGDLESAADAAGKKLEEAADHVADGVDEAAEKAKAAKEAAAVAANNAVNSASVAVGQAATNAAEAINNALPKPAGSGVVVHTDPETGKVLENPLPGSPPVGGDVKMPKMAGE